MVLISAYPRVTDNAGTWWFHLNVYTIDVVYHHPSPASGLFSLPSARDFQVFVEAYPHIQTHFILERHGFIRVTFDWTPYNKPDPNEMFTRLTRFLSDHGVNERIVDIDGFAFYKSSVEWRYVINEHGSSFTHHCFGLRLCFISWDEPLELRLLSQINK